MKHKNILLVLSISFLLSFFTFCQKKEVKQVKIVTKMEDKSKNIDPKALDSAIFGAGCFWCVEAVFLQLDGVSKVVSGYMGGKLPNPTYKEVCSGLTGHAEVCKIYFNPTIISFDELLEAFWQSHDPTTLNQQGNDRGTQYRSAIFYGNDNQKKLAEEYKVKLDKSGAFSKPITTEITAQTVFYNAEDYHQNYYNLNGDQPYCQYVIAPKVEKFRKVFNQKLK